MPPDIDLFKIKAGEQNRLIVSRGETLARPRKGPRRGSFWVPKTHLATLRQHPIRRNPPKVQSESQMVAGVCVG